ncbi:porin family protein [Ancylobacter sp. MQZ15Z-1]|uniref:Porin family protein n=1 Tax=Ancylobacter mangrovi TaxID=2972472 RepID=A0A9X2PK94_9HYPH|nr:outer membrane protein [Ancylobacter mangrovi]MCS0496787.1 porin family protein [Ancylobacter mangrovi]
MRNGILTSVAVLLLGSSAFAADLPVKAPVMAVEPVPVFTWTGFYLGVNAGYGWGSSDFNSGLKLDNQDGGLVGGQIGYNYQLANQIVLGAEADLQYSDLSDSATFDSGSSVSSKLRYFGTLRARLGYAFDTWLPYVTGGLAYGSNKVSFNYSTPVDESNTHVGYTVGGGLEYAFSQNISARVEYLYTDLGEETYVGRKVDVDFNTVRAGLNYRF